MKALEDSLLREEGQRVGVGSVIDTPDNGNVLDVLGKESVQVRAEVSKRVGQADGNVQNC